MQETCLSIDASQYPLISSLAMIEERLIADSRPSKLPFYNRRHISGFLVGFYKSVKLENNDAMLCKKKPNILWKQSVSVTLTRFGTIVITRSSMLLPHTSAFFIELCQEVVVMGFNKG